MSVRAVSLKPFLDLLWEPPAADARVAELDRDVENTMAEFKEMIEQQCRDEEEAWSALDDLQRAFGFEQDEPSPSDEHVVWEPNPDEPLTIAQAVCLPELGGRLFIDGTGIESKHVRPYAVRNAIAEGRLQLHAASRRGSHLLSRNLIKEWIESKWQDVENRPASSSKASASTKTAPSKPRNGSSNILTREKEALVSSALDSALSKLQKRRSTSRNG